MKLIQITGLNIEPLDVGHAVWFEGDESKVYASPGSDKILQVVAARLRAAGVDVGVHVPTSGPATPSSVLTPTAAPVASAPPAASESLFASLTSPSTARATLAAEFGATPFTSRMVSDLTGVEIGRCSVAISKLAEAGLIEAAGPRTKQGIPYRVSLKADVPAKETETPPAETEPGAGAEAFMDAVKDPEPEAEKAVEPEPEVTTAEPEATTATTEPEPEATTTEPEKVEEKPAPPPTKTSDRALLVGQAETCKNAGWPREKALASLQRMAANHGAVDIADIEAILASVYGAGEEEDAPF